MVEPVTAEALRHRPVAGAVDESVKIPKAISDAGKRADAIQQALIGSETAPVTGDGNPDGAPDDGTSSAPLQAPPSDPPILEGEPAAGETWERRFKGLQGRYDRDVRQTREALAQMSDQIVRLQNENASLRPVAAAAATAQPPPPASLISDQERQEYGEEFIDVSRRIAQEVAAPLVNEITSLRSQLGMVQQETGNSFMTRMNEGIGSVVKNWREINQHPRFIEWAKLPDVFSGAIRQQLMQDAWNAGDTRRVAAFFQAFLAEEATVDPQRANGHARPAARLTVTPVSPTATFQPTAPQMTLEDLAAPGRAHSAALPAEKPVYSSADIARFYTDVKLGRYRGREQQQVAIDADIMAAGREGRIIVDQRSVLPVPGGFSR
jgi:hypothetical protein